MILLAALLAASPAPSALPDSACAPATQDAQVVERATVFLRDSVTAQAEAQGSLMKARVEVTIAPDGRISGARIWKSSGNDSLDQAALEAAQATIFHPKLIDCKPVTGTYLLLVEFPRTDERAAEDAPRRVVNALEGIAALHGTRFGFCEGDEGKKAQDDAREGLAQKAWARLVGSQRDYAAELAQCALLDTSLLDFTITAGFSVASLVSSIGADFEGRDDSYSYQYQATALALPVMTWLASDPQAPAKERSWQSNQLRILGDLTSYATGRRSGYPIPFTIAPDWQGTYPDDRPRPMAKTKALGRDVVAIFATSQSPQLDSELAASDAYEIVFRDYKWRGPPNAYLVVTIYSPVLNGASNVFAYVFALDAQRRWRPRLIPERERGAIEQALGNARTGIGGAAP